MCRTARFVTDVAYSRSGLGEDTSVGQALFTGVRGRLILGSSDAGSCIDPPSGGAESRSEALHASWATTTPSGAG
jgi:hypothetical protein